jgi:poly-beta-1,6-N-acetyl-D-glucosamine synthase
MELTQREKDLPRRVRGVATAHEAAARLTVLVPAYNEGASVADTIRSLQAQTVPVASVIVIDDCSTDDTAEVARALGVTVIRPPVNTGSKAGAQNYALQFVDTDFTMAIDADTALAANAIELLMQTFVAEGGSEVAAACGFVLPRHVRTVWERGRYVEYLFAFGFYKPIQDFYGKPLIASGCFSAYRTEVLKAHGGWGTRTVAEDMDLTWSFYEGGHRVRFVPEALCYPIEPHTYDFMRKQLRRWSHGFVQNVRVHWRPLLDVPYLRSAVAVSMWDATIAAFVYLLLLPVLAIALGNPWLLLGYVIDVPAVLVPVAITAGRRGELGRALASVPAFLVLRTVNAVFFLGAVWSECIAGHTLRTFEKGH